MSILSRAISKCQHYPTINNQWCGYLTAVEILTLVEAGAQTTDKNAVTNARACIAIGRAGTRWFYFTPNNELKALLPSNHKKVGTAAKV